MSGPGVVRISEAPNWAAERFGLDREVLDMRILRGVLGCEHLGISHLTFGPHRALTVGHRHPGGGEEVYVLVSGRARIKVEGEIHELVAPSALRVPADKLRGIRADGDEPAVFVVAGSPIDDPDETEIVPGFWPLDE
ncbi:MAG TPA: cupin domain-containing protein [Gaiellaceae bacterium]|nr:cupin domain-containing protein [Gaiellaceae bacterium]